MNWKIVAVVMAVAVLAAQPAQARRHGGAASAGNADVSANQAGVFDYYALSLSWAPTYCASHPSDTSECGSGRGFGFVLHGLWPQYEQGWPQNCSQQTIPPAVAQQYASLYPSPSLMQHEWAKHGTCSGLEPEGYFTLSDKLKGSVQIPSAYQKPAGAFSTDSASLAKAFLAANPELKEGGVLAVCSGKFLSEIHVCFDRSGVSRACSASETRSASKSCGSSFLVRSVR